MSKLLKKVKITITEQGLKVNTSVTLSQLINYVLNALLAVVVGSTTEDNKERLYQMLSVAFTNVLTHYGPEFYFDVDKQELVDDEQAVADLAAGYDSIDDALAAIKEDVASRINPDDVFGEGETMYTTEDGKVVFQAKE